MRIIEVIKKQLKIREMKKKGSPYDPEDEGESAIGGKLGEGITEKVIVTLFLHGYPVPKISRRRCNEKRAQRHASIWTLQMLTLVLIFGR